jgi:hypothetical protein
MDKRHTKIPEDHILYKDPELAVIWSLFQSAWDNTELRLLDIFSLVTNMDYFSARFVFDGIKGNEEILEIIKKLIKSRSNAQNLFHLKKSEIDDFSQFTKEIGKANTTRNRLIHGAWELFDNKVRRVTFRGDFSEVLRKPSYSFSKAEIQDFIDELNALNIRVSSVTVPANAARLKKRMQNFGGLG